VKKKDVESSVFIDYFKRISKRVHLNSINKGFWDNRNELGIIANLHGEVSEAFDALVRNNPDDGHCPDFTSIEVELADIIIRIMDEAQGNNYRVAEALIEKMKYNVTRSYRHGNKEY